MTYPDTITFEADGKEHIAVVGLPKQRRSDAMTRTVDGVDYEILIPLGSIPGYPDAAFIARPVQ